MTCTATSSPTRRAAAAPASVAALTAPTSPRTITVTYPAPIYSLPIRTTLAALTIASAASMEPTNPLVSIIPKASLAMRSSLAFPPTESVPAISNEFCNPGVRVARVEPSTAPKANQAGWEHLWKTSAASGRRTQENLERGSPLPLFSGARNRRAGPSEVKKQIPRGVYPAPGGARNDNQKHFFSKLLSLLAGWLTAGCCSGVKHCSPGLRKVVAQGSHNDVINSYGFATGARPGPPVDVGIRHTVLQCALFTPPEAIPETGLNLPHVAILSIAGLRRAWSF